MVKLIEKSKRERMLELSVQVANMGILLEKIAEQLSKASHFHDRVKFELMVLSSEMDGKK